MAGKAAWIKEVIYRIRKITKDGSVIWLELESEQGL